MTPFLHLCLQSGSDKILKLMRREYSVNGYLNLVNRLREHIQNINISTDIMVGFPNESLSDFNQTINVINNIKFANIHTFRYSKRNKTLAAKLENQIDEKIKTERADRIRKLDEKLKRAYRKSFIGKKQRVLIEKINTDKTAIGYGQHYIPIILSQDNVSKNQFYDVKISGINSMNFLTANLVSK